MPHGAAVGAARGDHGHARGQVGHGLAEEWSVVYFHRSKRGSRAAAHKGMHRSSAGSVSGWSVRWWAPRLSSRARPRRRSGAPAGTGRRAARAGRPASRRRPAWRQSAARVASPAGRAAPGSGAGRGAGGRRARRSAASAARRAEHEALGERVRGQPVGAVQAGARALAHRVEPGQRRAAVEVGGDAAHRVVRGRRHGQQVAGAGRARPRRARRRCWGSARRRPRACRGRTAGSPLRLELGLDRQRHLVARRQLVHEALAVRRSGAWRPRRAPPR